MNSPSREASEDARAASMVPCRPILFSGPMVRAILAGKKTQTRRVVARRGYSDRSWQEATPHPNGDGGMGIFGSDPYLRVPYDEERGVCGARLRCRYGRRGDRLWVRETWQRFGNDDVVFRATDDCDPLEGWRPAIYMPRWASRIVLEITKVRVERLQAISELDCEAELGAEPYSLKGAAYERFATLWDAINGKRAPWSSNPWVWVIEFRRVDGDGGRS